MKSILLILIVLNVSVSNYAQPFGEAAANYRIKKMYYENSSGEKASTYFKYNKYGKLYKAFWSLDNKSRHSINYYEHDSNGCLVSAFRDFSDGLTSYELFIYDSLGNKTSERFYRSDSVSGFASYQYERGRLNQACLTNYKGWLNGTLTYYYNNKNRRERAVLIKDGNIICYVNYEYAGNQNLVKEFWDFNGKWSQTSHYQYEKWDLPKNYYSNPLLSNSGKYRINKETYTYNNETGGPSVYFYDATGLLFKKVFNRSDSISTTTFYNYDTERKLVSSKREYSNGDIAKFTYSYDENNNLVLRSYYRADTLYGFESYVYNSEGELMKAHLNKFDNWLSGTISFNSNESGIITSGEFKGQNSFDAFISFDYNTEGLLTEMKWEFTFGKFQQYIFEYEPTESP
ncbi:hypothetical protein ES705_37197 [subsurface metagenome]